MSQPQYRGYLAVAHQALPPGGDAGHETAIARLDLAILILGGAILIGVAIQLFRRYVR